MSRPPSVERPVRFVEELCHERRSSCRSHDSDCDFPPPLMLKPENRLESRAKEPRPERPQAQRIEIHVNATSLSENLEPHKVRDVLIFLDPNTAARLPRNSAVPEDDHSRFGTPWPQVPPRSHRFAINVKEHLIGSEVPLSRIRREPVQEREIPRRVVDFHKVQDVRDALGLHRVHSDSPHRKSRFRWNAWRHEWSSSEKKHRRNNDAQEAQDQQDSDEFLCRCELLSSTTPSFFCLSRCVAGFHFFLVGLFFRVCAPEN